VQRLDAEVVEQRLLDLDEVADGHDREAQAVGLARVGVEARRTGRDRIRVLGVQVHQGVGAEDEVAVGVERLAGADDRVPVAGLGVLRPVPARGVRVGAEEVGDEDGVVLGLV